MQRNRLKMGLLEIRESYGISQAEASKALGIPVRTYIRYEKDERYGSALKRQSMERCLMEKYEITEDKGLLTLARIKSSLREVFDGEYAGKIEFCFLFGSYAKGYAKDNSDVDLCIATTLTGLDFVGISESIRTVLHKRIDLIRFSSLKDNLDLAKEIMKDGIKIYG